ncbi:hypothetical protein Y032_0088g2203 [Ancylostoma ceylanicum]|uniref:Transposase IS30-like HTH domain-containing protein n=1 Tax=Ancylostoma ceylanicum TaxID=53326 RepID=A0A016TNV4_9BILA|nr:hypothetical protein Y032_0088g2203 [Ancylostoma ceylanicum]
MVRGPHLSLEEQAQAKAFHAAGFSNRAIAKRLRRSAGCIDRFLENPPVVSPPVSGHTNFSVSLGLSLATLFSLTLSFLRG